MHILFVSLGIYRENFEKCVNREKKVKISTSETYGATTKIDVSPMFCFSSARLNGMEKFLKSKCLTRT